MLNLVQEWLYIWDVPDEDVTDSDISLSPLCKTLPVLESTFPDDLLKAVAIPFAFAPFPATLFPSRQLSVTHNMLLYSTLQTDSLSAMTFSGLCSLARRLIAFWTFFR